MNCCLARHLTGNVWRDKANWFCLVLDRVKHPRNENLDGIDFVPVEIEAPVTLLRSASLSKKIDEINGDVNVCFDTSTHAAHIAEIAKVLAA